MRASIVPPHRLQQRVLAIGLLVSCVDTDQPNLVLGVYLHDYSSCGTPACFSLHLCSGIHS